MINDSGDESKGLKEKPQLLARLPSFHSQNSPS
jgi:hypothetical protein